MFTKTIRVGTFALVLASGLAALTTAGCSLDGTQQDPDPVASAEAALTKGPPPIMVPHDYHSYVVTCGGGYCSCTTSVDCDHLGASGVCSDDVVYYGTTGYCHTQLF
jgi:hypothetical protein